jgi:hypothetical protein
MSRYVRRIEAVDAWLWQGGGFDGAPQWIADAAARAPGHCSARIESHPGMKPMLHVRSADGAGYGTSHASYIIRSADGDLDCWAQERFEEQFQPRAEALAQLQETE